MVQQNSWVAVFFNGKVEEVNIYISVILLMVSPGTHFVKSHESHSRTNESQVNKIKKVRNYKCLSLSVTTQLSFLDRLQNSLG